MNCLRLVGQPAESSCGRSIGATTQYIAAPTNRVDFERTPVISVIVFDCASRTIRACRIRADGWQRAFTLRFCDDRCGKYLKAFVWHGATRSLGPASTHADGSGDVHWLAVPSKNHAINSRVSDPWTTRSHGNFGRRSYRVTFPSVRASMSWILSSGTLPPLIH